MINMGNPKQRHFDVIIAGGGITGTALLYVLSKYTDVKKIALLEKEDDLGKINTSNFRNSQTLHFGDIETNYKVDKAKIVKEAAEMVEHFVKNIPNEKLFNKSHSMVLAVGDKEVKILEKRYEDLRDIYPNLKKIGREELEKLEPKIIDGRDSNTPICALMSHSAITIDYAQLAKIFALEVKQKMENEVFYKANIKKIIKTANGYEIGTNRGNFYTKILVVAMGSYSLLYAKKLGYGKEFAILPVIGDYYSSEKRLLNGKVYTVQNPKLPFAAIHGDPNITDQNETRFGPTALSLPILERGSLKSFPDYLRSSGFDFDTLLSVIKIHLDKDVLRFILKNIVYNLPIIGRKEFLKTLKKIIPTISDIDLKKEKGLGGIRPQLVNKKEHKLLMGAAEIVGDDIIFNITPSPGATACLQNAEKMTKQIINFFNGKQKFDQESFDKDLR